jgi:hypothetical protein
MPTTYKRGKKKTTTKKPTKRPAKKGSKSGSKSGSGQALGPQEPIVISGGGSVHMKLKISQFKGSGGSWKNALANLAGLSIDGGPRIPLSPTSIITIYLS